MKAFTRYRVFIGSPGGLAKERRRFRDLLQRVTSLWAEPRGITFEPVGWEDTVGGRGRAQERINEDLRACDYAVFVLHDRWGSPTQKFSSGTEEEWTLARRLCERKKMRDMVVFFKRIDPAQSRKRDVRKIEDFKRTIQRECLYKDYTSPDMFCNHVEANLAQWLRDHEDFERSTLSRNASAGGRRKKRAARVRKPTKRGSPSAAARASSR